MEFEPSERPAAILGISFAVWLMVLIYLISSAYWIGVAVAVLVGPAILFVARSKSRAA